MVDLLLLLLTLDNSGLGGPPVGVEIECPLSDSMDERPGMGVGGIPVLSLDGRRISGAFPGVPREDISATEVDFSMVSTAESE